MLRPRNPRSQSTRKNSRTREKKRVCQYIVSSGLSNKLTLAVLYIRHKLQKGFISRDSPPNAEEMSAMSNYISKLESYGDLEVAIIRVTKINKVLKMIVKLNSLPRDEELQIRQRAMTLLSKWRHDLEDVPTPGDNKEGKAKVNGHAKEDSVDTPTKEEEKKLNEESNEHLDEPMPDVDAAEKPKEAEVPKEGEAKEEEKAEKAEEKPEEKPEEKKTEDKLEDKTEEKTETEKAPEAEEKDKPAEEQPDKEGEKTEKKTEEKAAEAA